MDYTNISMIGDSKKVRFVLKKEGKRPLIVLGINPSTADDISSDKTITRVMGYAQRLGFDSFIMLNVYPFRSPDIIKLPPEIDIDLHFKNLDRIAKTISQIENPTILIAYGDSISKKKYLRSCLNDILKYFVSCKQAQFIQLGNLTRKGNPRHPLFARADIEINNYIFKY